MSGKAYGEGRLEEVPEAGLFSELSWTSVSPSEESLGSSGPLQRETRSEVVLVARLRSALAKLNPTLPPEAIAAASDELTRDQGALIPAAANREAYLLLTVGTKVSVPDRERRGERNPCT